jgi:hypothetical protein
MKAHLIALLYSIAVCVGAHYGIPKSLIDAVVPAGVIAHK